MDILFSAFIITPIGKLWLSGTETALNSVCFEAGSSPNLGLSHTAILPKLLQEAQAQLTAYFEKRLFVFDLPLQLQGSNFQKRIWRQLLHVPFGRTASYLDIAHSIGDAKSVRAVGAANGKNPIAIIIPCHRVIGSSGALTGYAGGLERKHWLLQHEKSKTNLSLFE